MVEKSRIFLGSSLVILILSGILNVWFYGDVHRIGSRLDNALESRDYWRNTAIELEAEFNAYKETHSYTDFQYETGREGGYSQGYSTGYQDGYDAAEFSFYYVKPKNQKYGLESLKDMVNDVSWTSPYEEGVFDCSEMSAYMERYLENHGFHAIILVGDSPFGSGRHAWVLAETSEGKYMPVEATTPRVVLWDDTGFEAYFQYDDEFETIKQALDYDQTGFDWWTVYP